MGAVRRIDLVSLVHLGRDSFIPSFALSRKNSVDYFHNSPLFHGVNAQVLKVA
jgi:hypothetical protein